MTEILLKVSTINLTQAQFWRELGKKDVWDVLYNNTHFILIGQNDVRHMQLLLPFVYK
jgi:hypothetical protein